MSKFVLRPARILQTRLSPLAEDPITLTFEELVSMLGVKREDRFECAKLGLIKPGSFIGRVKSARTEGKTVVFLLHNPDHTVEIGFVMRNDPTFEGRLLAAYRVEEAVYDSKVIESNSEQAA